MHEKKLYGTATVGTKGQVVIPAEAREELGIQTGDRLYVIGSPKSGSVAFIQESQLEEFVAKINLNIETFNQQLKSRRNKEGK